MKRRAFLQHAALAGAAATLPSRRVAGQAAVPSTRAIDTRALSIAYEDHGDPRGFPVILLHGFPDDVRAFDDVVPPLTSAGHRALVPYLRGHGLTRFRDASTPRMAEQAAIGQDVIDFADTETRLASRPRIEAPSITLYGAEDGIARPSTESPPAERAAFAQLIARRVVAGVGHFMPRERPAEVSSALLELLAATR